MSNTALKTETPDFNLRPGRLDDYEALAHIKAQATLLFGTHYITQPLSGEVFTHYLDGDNLSVAVDGGDEVCGYSGVYQTEHDLFLHHLFVKQDYGRQGLGRLLLEAIITKAEILKCRAVTLVTSGSAPWNAPFYKKHGFNILNGEMPLYLQKRLDDDLKYFDPEFDFVKKSPLILPRVAMERLVA